MARKNKKTILDIDAIMDFIFAPEEKRSVDVQIEETFIPSEEENADPGSMSLMQKVRRETKQSEHAQHEAIRLQFVTRLMDDANELMLDEGEDMTFGELLAYNTLIQYGFVKEI